MIRKVSTLTTRLLRSPHSQACHRRPTHATAIDGGLLIGSQFVSYPRLRDACQCPQCIHPTTRQKSHTSGQAYLQAGTGEPKISLGERGVDVSWKGHSSFYSWKQLRSLNSPPSPLHGITRRFWDSTLQPSEYEYDIIQDHLGRLLHDLQTFGIVLIRNAPTQETSNQRCTLRRIAESIGEIRNTFYGELWDVKSVKKSRNVAYTNLDLGLHMDLLFQALHCLRNRVLGGESYVVDAFRAVEIYRELFPRSAHLVNEIGIEYEYDNDGHFLRFRHPLFTEDLQNLHAAVNWSPPFQAQTARGEHDYYRALYEFEQILNRPQLRHEFLLREGDVMLFDNRRILHARRAFQDEEEDGLESNRWLKGCYLDGEAVWDKLATLHRVQED